MRPVSDLVAEIPAGSLDLLSIEDLRSAAGVANDSQDEALEALGTAAAGIIANVCNVRGAFGSTPTLMAETLVETFHIGLTPGIETLVLSRRPVQELIAVEAAGSELSDYTLIANQGLIRQGNGALWSGTIVVTYVGGFEDVPGAVRYAAMGLVKQMWGHMQQDAAAGEVRRLSLEGVGSVDYVTGSSASGQPLVPNHVAAMLAPYVNYSV